MIEAEKFVTASKKINKKKEKALAEYKQKLNACSQVQKSMSGLIDFLTKEYQKYENTITTLAENSKKSKLNFQQLINKITNLKKTSRSQINRIRKLKQKIQHLQSQKNNIKEITQDRDYYKKAFGILLRTVLSIVALIQLAFLTYFLYRSDLITTLSLDT